MGKQNVAHRMIVLAAVRVSRAVELNVKGALSNYVVAYLCVYLYICVYTYICVFIYT